MGNVGSGNSKYDVGAKSKQAPSPEDVVQVKSLDPEQQTNGNVTDSTENEKSVKINVVDGNNEVNDDTKTENVTAKKSKSFFPKFNFGKKKIQTPSENPNDKEVAEQNDQAQADPKDLTAIEAKTEKAVAEPDPIEVKAEEVAAEVVKQAETIASAAGKTAEATSDSAEITIDAAATQAADAVQTETTVKELEEDVKIVEETKQDAEELTEAQQTDHKTVEETEQKVAEIVEETKQNAEETTPDTSEKGFGKIKKMFKRRSSGKKPSKKDEDAVEELATEPKEGDVTVESVPKPAEEQTKSKEVSESAINGEAEKETDCTDNAENADTPQTHAKETKSKEQKSTGFLYSIRCAFKLKNSIKKEENIAEQVTQSADAVEPVTKAINSEGTAKESTQEVDIPENTDQATDEQCTESEVALKQEADTTQVEIIESIEVSKETVNSNN